MENQENMERGYRARRNVRKPQQKLRPEKQEKQKKQEKPKLREKLQKPQKPPKVKGNDVKNVKKAKRGAKPVRIVFLGGVGEIGKNMTAVECGDDIIIIDAGAIFPTDETPGFDLVVPDITYLVENKRKVRGVVLTHGHEDHIGGIPYLLKELKIPVAGTKLTLALVDNKLREHRINDAKLITITAGQPFQFGCFKIRPVNVNHSIAGSLALAIETPQGVIFHSGDFKIDLTPVAGEPIDLKTISDTGSAGVLLYMGESTNIERAGFTMSETVVGATLDRLFEENGGNRLIIATFASNVHRLQQIFDLAVKHKRKVALSGRSMLNVVEAAEKIGEIKVPENALVDISHIKNMRDDEIVIVSTGSQGEPMSALTRMANGELPAVSVGKNDTIIISASPIPGNEKSVTKVINELLRKGADVIFQDAHVSGHACQEEIKLLYTLIHPRYSIPVHGEYKHLKAQAKIAMDLGIDKDDVFILQSGDVLSLDDNSAGITGKVPVGAVLVDGLGVGDVGNVVLRDRQHLAEDGILIVVLSLDGASGELLAGPDIVSRGFVYVKESDELLDEARKLIEKAVLGCLKKNITDWGKIKGTIKDTLSEFVWKKTKRRPMILPIIMEV